MATTPAFTLCLAVLLLLVEVKGNNGGSPDSTDNIQSRIIPPFSPSLELARTMGSSPVTPQGNENSPLENPRDTPGRYSSYPGDRPEELMEGVLRGVVIPDAVYPRDLVSEQGPRWPKDDVPPLGDLGLSDEEDEDEDCPPRLAEGFITLRRNNRVVRATLPHMVPSSCTPPLRCSVSTTIHRRVFLQDGDTLEVILQAPPDYTPPTPTHPPTPTFTPSPPTSSPVDVATEIYPEEAFTDQSTSIPNQQQLQPQQEQDSEYDSDQEGEQEEEISVAEQQRKGSSQQNNQDLNQEDQLNSPIHQQKEQQQQQKPPTQQPIHKTATDTSQQKKKQQRRKQKQQQQQQKQKQQHQHHNHSVASPQPQPPLHQESSSSSSPSASSEHVPSAHSGPHANNKTHLFSREDHHITSAHSTVTPTITRRKRQVVGGSPHFPQLFTTTRKPPAILDGLGDLAKKKKKMKEEERTIMVEREDVEEDEEEEEEKKQDEDGNQLPTSPLTIWRVSVAEWSSCSTREGGQIGDSSPEGIVTITPRFLQVGTNYFIGRSSWSSTECFQLQVTVRSAECGEGSLCSGKGTCYANTTMEHFQCNCCKAFIGTHCEEMNACISSPCLNSGICVDIQEGHDGDTFQCLCRYGYRGRYCEERTNLCESDPCQNGATCTGNHSTYMCRCALGWSGQQCTEPVETVPLGRPEEGAEGVISCTNSPCNNGICVETPSQDIRCFCHPGFGGLRCEFEYNECVSNPCENGGTCVDHVGKYQCMCGRGYTGERCQIKYDLCSPDPCPGSRVCVDKGNSYSCECLNGLSEDNCGPHLQVCTPNPCENGGTCWIVSQARVFYCSCRPGFTGTTCQGITLEINDEAVPETVGAVGTVEPGPSDVVHLPLNHMRNIYVAFATLASALLIFAIVVGACHCRVNRTYRKCFVKLPRPSKVLPSVRRPRPTSLFDKSRWERSGALRLETDPDGAAMPMTSSNANSDAVYYNMDVCDNQELPLIK